MSRDELAADIDVLIVGSGPGGAAAALFLATYGTRALVVTKYGHLSDTPRAHITNQRTMETLRDMGPRGHAMGVHGQHDLLHQSGRR
jgi:2-polyprenyl-6-methoxyphenol hydroxylase-like FAD-dependent oxidoreductase